MQKNSGIPRPMTISKRWGVRIQNDMHIFILFLYEKPTKSIKQTFETFQNTGKS